MNLHIYENMLWNIIDDASKIYILTLLIKNDFEGECRVLAEVDKESPESKVIILLRDENGKEMELPINVLDILNN